MRNNCCKGVYLQTGLLLCAVLFVQIVFAQVPKIASFSPSSGPVGSNVTITGMSFSPTATNNTVYFGAVKGTVVSATSTSLLVRVPAGATYETITVITNNLSAVSTLPFRVTFPGGGAITSNSLIPAGYLNRKGNSDDSHNVAVADLDGDGLADIASTNPNPSFSNISIYRNLGGSFAARVNLQQGYRPSSISCRDVDSDGKLDLVATNDDSTIYVYKNFSSPGSISFQRVQVYKLPDWIYPNYVSIADLTDDGKPEIIVRLLGLAKIAILRNTSSGSGISFSSSIDYLPTKDNSKSVVAVDIDNDGKTDLVTPNRSYSSFSIFRNTGTGGNLTFTETEVAMAQQPFGFEVADFDGDGRADLLVTQGSSPYTLSIFRNQSNAGNISLLQTAIGAASTFRPAVTDINGDGRPDVVLGTFETADRVYFYENKSINGTIAFADRVPFVNNDMYYGEKIVCADLNNDGKTELVIPNPMNGTITVSANQMQSNYYSKDTGALTDLSSWGVNADGTGEQPTSFYGSSVFHLSNRIKYILTGDWHVENAVDVPSGKALELAGNTLGVGYLQGLGTIMGSPTSDLFINDTGSVSRTVRFSCNNCNSQRLGVLRDFEINRPSGSSTIIDSALEVYRTLNITTGNLTGDVIFKSNATGTALIRRMGSNVYSGNVTVERYIPARKAWRLLSSPVSVDSSIKASWQEGATTSSSIPNPSPGYGTQISGGTASNGFDAGNFQSIKRYNNSNDTWVPLTNTNLYRAGSIPYMVYINGDRSMSTTSTAAPSATTLRAKGKLKTGSQTYPVDASNYTAIPNPYPSPINFASITRTNVQNSFWVWDPKLGGAYGVGGWVNVSWNGSSYDVTPTSVSPESQYLQSGQAFMVKSTGVGGSVVITETCKALTPSQNVFRSSDKSSKALRVTLKTTGDKLSNDVVDEVLSSFSDAYSSKIDELDVTKLANIGENLAIERETGTLMIDRRPELKGEEVIQLKLWNVQQKTYQFEINPSNLSSVHSATLEDAYLHTSTHVDLNKITQYSFTISGDAASQNPDRFRIILNGKASSPSIAASEIKDGIRAYPNPFTGKTINIEFDNEPKGIYTITLIDSKGQKLVTQTIYNEGGLFSKSILLNQVLSKGLYQLQINNGDTKSNIPMLKD